MNEADLGDDIIFGYTPHSPLADHMYRLNPLQGPPGSAKGAIAHGEPHPPFHVSMILLDDVVQVLTYAVKGAGPQREKSRPGTGSLHPVAIGAAVEVTKLLKPPV